MSSVASPAQAPKKNRRPSLPIESVPHRTNGHQRPERWDVLGPALVDLLLVAGSGLIAYRLRFSSHLFSLSRNFPDNLLTVPHGAAGIYLGFLLVYAALLVLVAYSQKLYSFDPSRSPLMEGLLVAQAVTVATVILTAFIYLSGIKSVSRLVVGVAAVCSLAALSGWRLSRWYLMRRRLAKGIGLRHAVIIGAGKVGTLLADYLRANPSLGYDVRGFLDSNHHGDPRILGTLDDLARVARQQFADEVFITIPSERELVKQMALEAMQLNLGVKVVPELYDGLAWQCPLDFVGEVPVRVLHREPIPAFGLFLKRMTDVFGSAAILLLLSPILALIALAIVVDSPGPVFYRAYRMGKKGRKFLCYKFRTMVPNADDMKEGLRSLNERDGPFFKIANDPRLTRIGGFLRKYSVDELPQLWNVLRGEMSMVGPRPHPLDDVKNYTLEHFRRLDVTPGITCLWQTEARHDPSFEKNVALDSKYIENWSYLLDLKILLRTIPTILKGTGR
jgi:exopolysaccharide biosynthesis polyprenyl glycosylphosphotransferase